MVFYYAKVFQKLFAGFAKKFRNKFNYIKVKVATYIGYFLVQKI